MKHFFSPHIVLLCVTTTCDDIVKSISLRGPTSQTKKNKNEIISSRERERKKKKGNCRKELWDYRKTNRAKGKKTLKNYQKKKRKFVVIWKEEAGEEEKFQLFVQYLSVNIEKAKGKKVSNQIKTVNKFHEPIKWMKQRRFCAATL